MIFRVKFRLLILIWGAYTFGGKCQSSNISYKESGYLLNIDSPSLIGYLNNLADSIIKYKMDNKGEIFEIKFFNTFPSSFEEFKSLYGYSDDSISILGAGYYLSHKHIVEVFSQLKFINDSVFASKIIRLCLNGDWQADAVNDLQHILKVKMHSDMQALIYFQQLSTFNDNRLKQFWKFYFSHTEVKEDLSVFRSMKNKFPKVYQIMEYEYSNGW